MRDDWWARVDAIEPPQGKPWPVLATVLLLALGAAMAAGPEPDADTDHLRREETVQLVKRAHERMRADSLAVVADSASRRADVAYRRWQRDRAAVPTWHPVDTTYLPALPPVRGGWTGLAIGTDTLPTPRIVVALLVEQDRILVRADSLLHDYRMANAAYSLAVHAFRSALAHGDSARALAERRHAAAMAVERKRKWRWLWIGAALGGFTGLILGG